VGRGKRLIPRVRGEKIAVGIVEQGALTAEDDLRGLVKDYAIRKRLAA
jgi:hypothetical protein